MVRPIFSCASSTACAWLKLPPLILITPKQSPPPTWGGTKASPIRKTRLVSLPPLPFRACLPPLKLQEWQVSPKKEQVKGTFATPEKPSGTVPQSNGKTTAALSMPGVPKKVGSIFIEKLIEVMEMFGSPPSPTFSSIHRESKYRVVIVG